MFDPESLFGAHMAGQPLDGLGGAAGGPADGPVVVFVHGFQHEPRRPVLAGAQSDDGHRTIYHFTETPGGPGSAGERRLRTTPCSRAPCCRAAPARPGTAAASPSASATSREPFLPGLRRRLWTRFGVPSPWTEPPRPNVDAYQDAETAGHGLAAC